VDGVPLKVHSNAVASFCADEESLFHRYTRRFPSFVKMTYYSPWLIRISVKIEVLKKRYLFVDSVLK
jgi:hypothetical protein